MQYLKHGTVFALNLLAAAAALLAARYWYRSAIVSYPSHLLGVAPWGGGVHVNIRHHLSKQPKTPVV
jgi:hypothetical protein